MKLSKLLASLQGCHCPTHNDPEVSGVELDSRQVRPGSIFVALPGLKTDGWLYVKDAIERGAVAVVSEHEPPVRGPVRSVPRSQGLPVSPPFIQVADARLALASLACTFHGNPAASMDVVGITGTNGKTTTTYMLKNMLQNGGREVGLLSTIRYEFGGRTIPSTRTTPEATELQSLLAKMKESGCDSVVMEVSSHALVQNRTGGIGFRAAIFTNLTRDHLDYHESMDSYFKAKLKLFQALGKGAMDDGQSFAIINIDDIWGRQILAGKNVSANTITYGMSEDAQVRAEQVVLTAEGTTFRVNSPWGRFAIEMSILGRYNISNALASIATAGAMGISTDTIAKALAKQERVAGRLEDIRTDRGFQIFVDYAHTDDALSHVLKTLREITSGRLIVVFGCGGDRDRSKRPAMGEVASRLADHTILTSDNPRTEDPGAILADIRSGCLGSNHCDTISNRREAIARALGMAKRGDTVLIAGKGHESFQEFANKTVPFDDRTVAIECLSQV